LETNKYSTKKGARSERLLLN